MTIFSSLEAAVTRCLPPGEQEVKPEKSPLGSVTAAAAPSPAESSGAAQPMNVPLAGSASLGGPVLTREELIIKEAKAIVEKIHDQIKDKPIKGFIGIFGGVYFGNPKKSHEAERNQTLSFMIGQLLAKHVDENGKKFALITGGTQGIPEKMVEGFMSNPLLSREVFKILPNMSREGKKVAENIGSVYLCKVPEGCNWPDGMEFRRGVLVEVLKLLKLNVGASALVGGGGGGTVHEALAAYIKDLAVLLNPSMGGASTGEPYEAIGGETYKLTPQDFFTRLINMEAISEQQLLVLKSTQLLNKDCTGQELENEIVKIASTVVEVLINISNKEAERRAGQTAN